MSTCPPAGQQGHDKFRRLVERAQRQPPAATAIAHPCDEVALESAVEAARLKLIEPILVGPEARIRGGGRQARLRHRRFEIVDAEHSHDAAAKAVELVRAGRAEALMKGSLHTDELMAAVVARETGPAHRAADQPLLHHGRARPRRRADHHRRGGQHRARRLEDKVHIVQNAIDLAHALGVAEARVAILSAMETVNPKVLSTLEAAALCKMADRGQITGGLLDGPLALDNAISPEAAAIKKIVSPVAGRANVLVVPDLEAGNMLAKSLSFLAGADAAGIVLGARVPIILTSRADSLLDPARLLRGRACSSPRRGARDAAAAIA